MNLIKTDKTYLSQLTFTRFIAAFIVVIHHYGENIFPFNTSWIVPLIKQGNVAVSYFFFLSGFVLMVSYWNSEKLSFGNFLKKRFARIYPVYFAALVLTALIFFVAGTLQPIKYFLAQAFMIDAWSPYLCSKYNYPGWTISVEMFFYCLFPFCVFFFKKRSFFFFLIFTVLFWTASQYWELVLGKSVYKIFDDADMAYFFLVTFPVFHVNTFLFGMFGGFCFFKLKQKNTKPSNLPLYIWLLGVFALCIVLSFHPKIMEGHIYNGLFCPLFMLITIGLALDQSAISRLFSKKPLVYLGDVSYGIYILQFPVLMIFLKITGIEELNLFYFMMYSLFLILIASLAYTFYEKKVRKWILKK